MAKVHAIIASDSRGKYFLNKLAPNKDLYTTHKLVCRGATVETIGEKFLALIRSDIFLRCELIIIRIACGINNLTCKEYHQGGCEVSLKADVELDTILELL